MKYSRKAAAVILSLIMIMTMMPVMLAGRMQMARPGASAEVISNGIVPVDVSGSFG